MTQELRKTGLPAVGPMPWGSHCCLFYRSRDDLCEAVAGFLRAGLESGERCLWLTEHLEEGRAALQTLTGDVARYERAGQIELLKGSEWYATLGSATEEGLFDAWMEAERRALDEGFKGLRAAGEAPRDEPETRGRLSRYESAVGARFHDHRILALCAYALDECLVDDLVDVATYHHTVVVRDRGTWRSARRLTLSAPGTTAAGGPLVRHPFCLFEDAAEEFGDRAVPEEARREEPGSGELRRRRLTAIEDLATALAGAPTFEAVRQALGDLGPILGAVGVVVRDSAREGPQATADADPARAASSGAGGPPRRAEWLTGAAIGRYPEFSAAAERLAVLPLVTEESDLGTMYVLFGPEARFDAEDRRFLESIAHQAAVALDRAAMADRIERERRSRIEWVATVSHELRNPLSTIKAISAVLSLEQDSVEREHWQEALARQTEHMALLLDAMLDFSRLLHGGRELRKERVDVRRILREAAEDKRVEIEQRELGLRMDFGDEEGAQWILGDRMRLTQVFHNLLGNSVKFTDPPGEITVRFRSDADGAAVIEVSDTGAGIEPELLPRVFEPFTQSAIARPGESGLGLGLALVRNIVELHGGSVSARSRGSGQGSTFTVTLPPG